MTLFAELTEKFGPALDVPGVGLCLAISGEFFDPDWEAELSDQGFTVLFETWDNHPMTVVPLKISGNVEVKDVEQVKEEKHLVCWTADEIERFVRLWNENPQYKFLMAHFPGRTETALIKKASELKKMGIIENSYIVKNKLIKNE